MLRGRVLEPEALEWQAAMRLHKESAAEQRLEFW